jgi:hypothetical protein
VVKALDVFAGHQNLRRIEAQHNDHHFRRTTLASLATLREPLFIDDPQLGMMQKNV